MMSRRSRQTRGRSLRAVAAVGVLLAALAGATPAFAEGTPAPIPHWKLESRPAPTNLPLKGEGLIVVTLANLGSADVNGEAQQVKVTDTLPAGLEATAVSLQSKSTPRTKGDEGPGGFSCHTSTPPADRIECTFGKRLAPYDQLEILINVKASLAVASEPDNEVTVEGGETASASLSRPLRVNGEATSFGVEEYELVPENADGSPDTRAGSHPFQLTTTFDLNETLGLTTEGKGEVVPTAPALQKDLSFKLPPGLIGDADVLENPNAVQQCEGAKFGEIGNGSVNFCPADTVVGVAAVTFLDPITLHFDTLTVPVFNLVPTAGEPARFGFEVEAVPVVLDTSIRSGEGYGVTVSVHDTSELIQLLGSRVTFWGVPGEPGHDEARDWQCLGYSEEGACGEHYEEPSKPAPLLTLPTSCAAPPRTTVSGDAWNGSTLEEAEYELPALTGCGELPFSPSIGVTAESQAANTPTGLTVHVHVPQESTMEASGLAESAVKDTTVELPEGVLLSPSAANGLEACPEAGVGFTGFKGVEPEPEAATATFTEKLPDPLEPGINFCANASKVGVVHIKAPDLPRRLLPDGELSTAELEGGVYLASQNANPFGSLFAMYIVAEEPESGVLVKLAGNVELNPQTGRITATFANTPEVPFEELTLELLGGPRASLTTPPSCGSYTTQASFTPWSGSGAASGTVGASSPFSITSGPGGSACSNPQPFAPSFQAGSTNTQAGAFTPFALTINRPDADQALTSLEMKLPEGLAGLLSSVTLCKEAEASLGTCGPESLIGEATATVGLGGEPFTETGGQVFITEKYDGAPFGLSIVVPTKAGPFNFGDLVTRSTINVNPSTAALTIDSTLPTMVNTTSYDTGVPVQLQQVHVVVNRANFQFNPTNCDPMALTGTLSGAQGASEAVSYPFQASNCASLPFAPKLTASVQGQASKANGASLDVKIESAGLGQANIHKVDLTLPKVLPSRLSTIQKACPEAVFNANPATCDEGSVIGKATVRTPVLKSPLTGPAYLVSHGGAAFPDVEFVLQGEGITLIVDGKTDIKNGITYSKFETAPDEPFTEFVTELPTGPHSALTAYVPAKADYSLCKAELAMPTEITAQNGAVIKQTTNIARTGCKGVLSSKVTEAQLLAKALKACKKDKKRSKRVACEKQARKKYGTKASATRARLSRSPARSRPSRPPRRR